MGRTEGGDEAPGDQIKQRLFIRRELVRGGLLRRWDDGMVVAYLGIVKQTPGDRQLAVRPLDHRRQSGVRLSQIFHALVYAADHIMGQVPAVSARIGDGLLCLVQALRYLQRFIRGKAQQAVGLPLQGGEVKQLGRQILLFFPDNVTYPACFTF
ncbi:hypothetical protein SDC9_135220 [bioreactor metagenome]|uniref:Uncharacterized protein n=1 Tax=bioreactor metagenome TaxID=1076179 RepID=A0A645DFS0_9ZZZZ